MAETAVCAASELPAEGLKAVQTGERSILIGRLQGQLVAYADRCPHAGSPLRFGKRRGEEITCPRHGWTFNLLTGRSVPDPSFCLTAIPIAIQHDQVVLTL